MLALHLAAVQGGAWRGAERVHFVSRDRADGALTAVKDGA